MISLVNREVNENRQHWLSLIRKGPIESSLQVVDDIFALFSRSRKRGEKEKA